MSDSAGDTAWRARSGFRQPCLTGGVGISVLCLFLRGWVKVDYYSAARTRRTWFSVAFVAGVEEKHRVVVVMVDGDDDNRGRAVLTAIAGCRASDGIRYLRSGAAIVWGMGIICIFY